MAGLSRITTGMITRNYENNLFNSMERLEKAREQVETGMRVNNSYEDPSAAAKAAILERRYVRNQDFMNNAKNAQNWLYAQDSMVSTIVDGAKEVVANYTVAAASDTNESERGTYALQIRSLQESMVLSLNTQYSNTYISAGEDGKNPPFAMDGDGELTYRNIKVSSTNPDDQEKLKKMMGEKTYVDLGFGLLDKNGKATDATALDLSLPGIKLVGYGVDDKGVPNNIIDLAGKLADTLEADTFDREEYGKYWDKFRQGYDTLVNSYTEIGTKENLVESTIDRLTDENVAITKQFDTAVNVEPAKAITNMSWAMYAYNTTLKVGTNIISPSLLDFMK